MAARFFLWSFPSLTRRNTSSSADPRRLYLSRKTLPANFKNGPKRGVRFQSTPRLRRIKYDHKAQAAPSNVSSMLLGEETPIWGGVFARFRDIDGNTFSLVSFDEVTHALEAQRR